MFAVKSLVHPSLPHKLKWLVPTVNVLLLEHQALSFQSTLSYTRSQARTMGSFQRLPHDILSYLILWRLHSLDVFIQQCILGDILGVYGTCHYQFSPHGSPEDHLHKVNEILLGSEASYKLGVVSRTETQTSPINVQNKWNAYTLLEIPYPSWN